MEVGQPFLIEHYNKTMGEVADRIDQNVDRYHTAICSKKCLRPIVAFFAWSVPSGKPSHRLTKEALSWISDFAFCRTIEREFLACGLCLLTPGRTIGFATSQHMVLQQIYSDRLDHLDRPRPTQLKCVCCSMKTKHRYCRCKVGIQGRSFIMFHTK